MRTTRPADVHTRRRWRLAGATARVAAGTGRHVGSAAYRAVDLRVAVRLAGLPAAFRPVETRAVEARAVDVRVPPVRDAAVPDADLPDAEVRDVAVRAVDALPVDRRAVDFFAAAGFLLDVAEVDFRAGALPARELFAREFPAGALFVRELLVEIRLVEVRLVDVRLVDVRLLAVCLAGAFRAADVFGTARFAADRVVAFFAAAIVLLLQAPTRGAGMASGRSHPSPPPLLMSPTVHVTMTVRCRFQKIPTHFLQ